MLIKSPVSLLLASLSLIAAASLASPTTSPTASSVVSTTHKPSSKHHTTAKSAQLETTSTKPTNPKPNATNIAPHPQPTTSTSVPPSTSSPIERTTGKRPGLITRTTDAIYRALTGYFSHDEDDEQEFGAKITTSSSTISPSPMKRQTIPTTTKPDSGSADAHPTATTTFQPSSTRKLSHSVPLTSTTSARPQLTLAPHLNLNFSDQNYDIRPFGSTRQRSSTTTKRPATEKPTTSATQTHPRIVVEPAVHPTNELQANSSSASASSVEFFSLLNMAIKSMYSVHELTYLNRTRTTRLARDQLESQTSSEREREQEREGYSEAAPTAAATSSPSHHPRSRTAKLTTRADSDAEEAKTDKQITSREDILLLCKLLHKHLEHAQTNTNGSITLNLSGPLGGNLTSQSGAPTTAKPSRHTDKPASELESTSTAPEVDPRHLIDDPQLELNEHSAHQDRLLESVFVLDQVRGSKLAGGGGTVNGTAYEEAGVRLLHELYNLGYYLKRRGSPSAAAAPSTNLDESELGGITTMNVSLKLWSKTTTAGGRLKLVYWLLEQVKRPQLVHVDHSDKTRQRVFVTKYKVLDLEAANELLDQLEHSLIQQTIEELGGLVRPLGLLVAPHGRRGASKPNDEQFERPVVIDDTLPRPADQTNAGSQTHLATPSGKSTLQLVIDRLSQSSLGDNFHLYSIIFVVIVFIFVLCVAVPALCCKCMMPAENGPAPLNPMGRRERRANGSGRAARNGARGHQQQQQHSGGHPGAGQSAFYRSTDPLRESISSISGALAAGNGRGSPDGPPQMVKAGGEGAIWRKLSNSTTTLTKDHIRTLEDEGVVETAPRPVNNKGGKLEWYSFEDNKEQTIRRRGRSGIDREEDQRQRDSSSSSTNRKTPTQSLVIRDQCKVTKSVQTYSKCPQVENVGECDEPDDEVSFPREDEHLSLAYRDRLETRNSNTLTKSELVMLKEKLIPIGRQGQSEQAGHHRKHVASSSSQPPPDYVNTGGVHVQSQLVKPPSRHIDSSSVESSANINGARNKTNTGPAANEPSESQYRALLLAEQSQQQHQRGPTMRYLEMPTRTQSKMEAIKDELGKIEARDAAALMSQGAPQSTRAHQSSELPAGTYKRYDVI